MPMKPTLIHPWRKKVIDVSAIKLTPPQVSTSRSSDQDPRAETMASNSTTGHRTSLSSGSFHRAATVANVFVQGNVRSVVEGMSRKRKLHQQRSFPDPSLPRRRRNDLVPAIQPEKISYSRWFIQPRATWKVRWDLWIGLIIAYSVILIPYRISFGIELAYWEQMMNYCFDSSFALDVLFNFFTGFYEEDVLVFELPRIRHRYLRSWFLFDAASTIPLDQFLQVVTTVSSSLLTLKLIRVFRLFRLLKLMRLLRLKRAVEAVQVDALNAHVLQTLKGLLTIIFIIHLVSCGWYMFYTWDPNGTNWVTNIDEHGLESPYLVSFYWVSNTMMSVGYGDVYAITDIERLYSIFVACLGSISVGMIIANIQMLTENYNPRGIKLRQKLQETKEFLIKRSIPRRLRQRVISQFEFHWSHRTVFDESILLHQFPRSLQYEILAASMESFVKKFPFFGVTSVEFFVFAIPRLRPIVLGPGQVLVDAESVWEELYFLTSGTIETVQSNLVVGSLSPGEICGIEYLINPRRRYTHTYRSISKAELYSMYSKDLLEAIDKCPVANKYLEDLAVILGKRYEESARRGKRALQRQRSIRAIRRESISRAEPFLHKRHRKQSISSAKAHTLPSDFLTRMDMSVVTDEVVTHWSIIRHYSKARITWDVLIGIMVSLTAVSVPFRIAFDVQDGVAFYATDRLSDVCFVLDVFLSFCTTYIDDTGVEITDRFQIRRHYLKTSFFVDVVSTIPFDFLLEALTVGAVFRSLKLIRTVKLMKLLRLVRLSKLFKMKSQWMSEFDINVDTVRLLKLLAPVMIISHYVGCFWYYISANKTKDNAWWGRVHFDDPESIISKYIASIYWAITTMTTVGFGDIYAVNDYEKAYCVLVVIGGTTLFAYVVGTVIEVTSNSSSLMNREHEMVQRVNAYIKERGVSSEFIVACHEHLRFVDGEKTFFVENSLFDALSYSLRSELILILNNSVMSKIRFFDKKPKWFLTLILPRLVPQYFLEGDILIYQDNPVSGIFFLMSGSVIAKTRHSTINMSSPLGGPRSSSRRSSVDQIVGDHHGTIAKIFEGEFFGYKEILTETVAQYNVFAMQATGTYLLSREFLDEFEFQYPKVADEIRSLIIQSITRQQKIVAGWQNNDAIGLTAEDREQVAEVNIARRSEDHDSIRASVTGVPMLARRHSSFATTGRDFLANIVQNAVVAQAEVDSAESAPRPDTNAIHDQETQQQTTVEPLRLRKSPVFLPALGPIAPPLIDDEGELDMVTTLSGRAPAKEIMPALDFSRRPNSATTLSAVHPSGGILDAPRRPEAPTMSSFRTGRQSSMRDTFAGQRRPSERFISSRRNEVTALVDELLSGEGFNVQRTASGRQERTTVTM